MKVELTITDAALRRALRAAGARAPSAAAAAVLEEAERIMGDSKANYVPVDLGTLRASGSVAAPVLTARGASVTLGYGGAASAYALAVHEHLSGYSPPSWVAAEASGNPVTFSPSGHGPKYLERPLLAAARGAAERLARSMRRGLRT